MNSIEINNLDKLMGGALTERFTDGLRQIAANIIDPNTDAKKKRKLQITVTFAPNENRDIAQMEVDVKVTQAPPVPVNTSVIIGADVNTGEVTLAEVTNELPGQVLIDGGVTEQKVVTLGGKKQ